MLQAFKNGLTLKKNFVSQKTLLHYSIFTNLITPIFLFLNSGKIYFCFRSTNHDERRIL